MTRHIAIIGGGASGTIMAAHLLRCHAKGCDVRITLIDAGANPARGLAYATLNPSHLLNVRAGQISAFADAPDHFVSWLVRNHHADMSASDFVPRMLYGQYLETLLGDVQPSTDTSHITIVRQTCLGLKSQESGVDVLLADGSVLPAHGVVIATGFGVGRKGEGALLDPWDGHVPRDREAHVVLVGTGLTMVDKVLSLLDVGHRGPIKAMSRRGLLPQTHGGHHPRPLSSADIPFGSSIHYFSRWLRQLVAAHQAAGGDWRDVMDGLRPHIQTIWTHLPSGSRRRFLRHCTAFWDIHRHRMPPAQAERIDAAVRSGQLTLLRGRFVAAHPVGDKTSISFIDPASGQQSSLAADTAYDCRGIRRQAVHAVPPFIASLLEHGQAKLDPLGLGLEFDPNCALVGADDKPSSRIYGIGPVTISSFWESIAIPDIRQQARDLAQLLITQ